MELHVNTENLDWQEGKVKNFFGKDLINLPNGTLKLVKINPNATYPIHQHPDKTEYVYVLEGTPSFTINGTHYEGEPGHFFIFPNNTMHAIENPSATTCLILVGAIKI